MIIVGYQGIGKSTLAGNLNCIDLESGNFWVDGKRCYDWYKYYVNIAKHLSDQKYTVLTASHFMVRKELKETKRDDIAIIYPSLELQDEWTKKLKERYDRTNLEKDYKAWKNAEENYVDNITSLSEEPFMKYEIKDMDYKLSDIVIDLINRNISE